MTYTEAYEIAEETIVFWQREGLTAEEAWQALDGSPKWFVDWWMVRSRMVSWLRRQK